MWKTNVKQRRAFTLIELMMVLVILAILAALVVPRLVGKGEKAKYGAAKADIAVLDGALSNFEVEVGRFPSNEEGLQALITPPANAKNWSGPYISKNAIPMDPWGNPYQYRFPGQNNPAGFDLWALDHESGDNPVNNWSQ